MAAYRSIGVDTEFRAPMHVQLLTLPPLSAQCIGLELYVGRARLVVGGNSVGDGMSPANILQSCAACKHAHVQ